MTLDGHRMMQKKLLKNNIVQMHNHLYLHRKLNLKAISPRLNATNKFFLKIQNNLSKLLKLDRLFNQVVSNSYLILKRNLNVQDSATHHFTISQDQLILHLQEDVLI